jgi:hypothetical protein
MPKDINKDTVWKYSDTVLLTPLGNLWALVRKDFSYGRTRLRSDSQWCKKGEMASNAIELEWGFWRLAMSWF